MAFKEKAILPFATTWVKHESMTLSETSKTDKEKYCMVSRIHGVFKKKKSQTQNRVEWWVVRAEAGGARQRLAKGYMTKV